MIPCATGSDNISKGSAACLGLTLYSSLRTESKEKAKQCVRRGEIILSHNGNTGEHDQLDIMKKILDVVAKNTAVNRIYRMVQLET